MNQQDYLFPGISHIYIFSGPLVSLCAFPCLCKAVSVSTSQCFLNSHHQNHTYYTFRTELDIYNHNYTTNYHHQPAQQALLSLFCIWKKTNVQRLKETYSSHCNEVTEPDLNIIVYFNFQAFFKKNCSLTLSTFILQTYWKY